MQCSCIAGVHTFRVDCAEKSLKCNPLGPSTFLTRIRYGLSRREIDRRMGGERTAVRTDRGKRQGYQGRTSRRAHGPQLDELATSFFALEGSNFRCGTIFDTRN